MNAIEVENLSKRFGPLYALRDITFELKEKETLGLVGDNGAGKSTLIKTLCGIHQPTTGVIRIFGKAYDFLTPDIATKIGIAAVHQEYPLVPQRSVVENFFIGNEIKRDGILGKLGILDLKKMRNETYEALKRMGINVNVNKPAGTLSGGEKQITAIARALYRNPKILLLDEPTTALSVVVEERFIEFLKQLKDKYSIIYISHNLRRVIEISDRIMVLRQGRIVDILDNQSKDLDPLFLSKLFLGVAK
jgi:ABC-type sugar transport system ATPase subunit